MGLRQRWDRVAVQMVGIGREDVCHWHFLMTCTMYIRKKNTF